MTQEAMTFSEALKANTRDTHNDVDETVMSKQPFASHENYGKFLQAQHEFHETLRPMFADKTLNESLAGLAERGRADRVIHDMKDLNVEALTDAPARPVVDGCERLGWIYCAEGSNVGAAILYRHAGKIELDEEKGASHLAAHEDGRMRHWRAFKDQLDELSLTDDEKAEALKGADNAFAYFKSVLDVAFK